jgi:hypothetical protein
LLAEGFRQRSSFGDSVDDFRRSVQMSRVVAGARPPRPVAARCRAVCVAEGERIWYRHFSPGLPGAFVSDIFREIDEEIRRDNLLKLWARFGRHIIVAVIVILLLAGGYVAWRAHEHALREAQATRFGAALALERSGEVVDAERVFAAIAAEGGGYAVLARFERAELIAHGNDAAAQHAAGTAPAQTQAAKTQAAIAQAADNKRAVAIYDAIARSDAVPPSLRDVAILFSVMHGGLLDHDPKAAIQRLQPLTAAGSPWRPSALELTAVARLKEGDDSAALALYKGLADDTTAPQGLRARAARMVAVLTRH